MYSNKKNFILPPQLHVRGVRSDISSLHFREVENQIPLFYDYSEFQVHRPYGGLWTSTYDRQFGSDWVQWNINRPCRGLFPSHGLLNSFLIYPKKDIRVYVLDNYQDLEKLMYRFRINSPTNKRKKIPFLDFGKISKHYDCLHLTKNGVKILENSSPYCLKFWDCESTLWFHLDAIERIEYIGKIDYQINENYAKQA